MGADAEFGALLRSFRLAAGLSQEALAERARLSARGISDLERGVRRTPRPETVALIADALELSAGDRATLIAPVQRQRRGDDEQVPIPAVAMRLPPAPSEGNASQVTLGLPVPPTPLVGRGVEAVALENLLRLGTARLVTLTGPGGVGKTRLALAVAATLAADDLAACFVDLAPLRDPDLVPGTIARALGLPDAAQGALREHLAAHLRAREYLLVLDNFEQVAPAATFLVALLTDCPRLRLLVTSRAALRLRGEQLFPLEPLALPPPGAELRHAGPPEDLARYAAIDLFLNRAQAVRPAFRLSAANAGAVVAICRRLDGLPLALELAAAWITLLTPDALLRRLDRRLPALARGAVDLPRRHQALRDTIAWSYALLDEAAQALFRHLAVFVGGCPAEAIEAVCTELKIENEELKRDSPAELRPTPHTPLDTLEGLATLVAQNLVRAEEVLTDGAETEMHYGMLETIREYATDLLEEHGEAAVLRQRHAAYYLALAEAAQPALTGPDQAIWLARLERDHDNLRAALRWMHARQDSEPVLRAAWGLAQFWMTHGHLREGRQWLEEFLAPPGATPPTVRAKAHTVTGLLAYLQGDYQRAATLHEAGLALQREAGDTLAIAEALHYLAQVVRIQGDEVRASALLEESLALRRAAGDTAGVANALAYLGISAYDRSEFARACQLFNESLTLFRVLGDAIGVAATQTYLGAVARSLGDTERARTLLGESLALQRGLGNKRGSAYTLTVLGPVLAAQGDQSGAGDLLREGLALFRDLGDMRGIAVCLEALAHLDSMRAQPELAARLLGAAGVLRGAIGAPLPQADRAAHDRGIATLRATLGDGAFANAWGAGRTMALEDTLALVLPR